MPEIPWAPSILEPVARMAASGFQEDHELAVTAVMAAMAVRRILALGGVEEEEMAAAPQALVAPEGSADLPAILGEMEHLVSSAIGG